MSIKYHERVFAAFIFFTRIPFWRLHQPPKEAYATVVEHWPLTGWLTGGIKAVFAKLVTEDVMKGEFLPEVYPERTAEGLYAILESCVLRIVLGTESNSANVKVRVSDMIRSISV